MASNIEYYEILGVEPGASREEIRQAYRSLCKKYHPDVNPDANASAMFRLINEAYQALSAGEQPGQGAAGADTRPEQGDDGQQRRGGGGQSDRQREPRWREGDDRQYRQQSAQTGGEWRQAWQGDWQHQWRQDPEPDARRQRRPSGQEKSREKKSRRGRTSVGGVLLGIFKVIFYPVYLLLALAEKLMAILAGISLLLGRLACGLGVVLCVVTLVTDGLENNSTLAAGIGILVAGLVLRFGIVTIYGLYGGLVDRIKYRLYA